MALADLKNSNTSKTVQTVGGDFEVFPLTLDDIGALLTKYRTHVEELLGGDVNIDSILKDAPDFAAEIIALASREPLEMAVKTVQGLPFSTQVIALNEVWGLTVYDPKELMAVINGLLSSMGAAELPTSLKTDKKAKKPDPSQEKK